MLIHALWIELDFTDNLKEVGLFFSSMESYLLKGFLIWPPIRFKDLSNITADGCLPNLCWALLLGLTFTRDHFIGQLQLLERYPYVGPRSPPSALFNACSYLLPRNYNLVSEFWSQSSSSLEPPVFKVKWSSHFFIIALVNWLPIFNTSVLELASLYFLHASIFLILIINPSLIFKWLYWDFYIK